VTALWALEQVYLDGWTAAVAAPSSPYAAFVEHWTSPAFLAYVDGLAALAAPGPHADLVAEVLAHEVAFWDMALS
jgi:thiaminase